MLEELRQGGTNAEIAVRLGLSPETVKTHVANMLSKLDLRGRRELAAWQPQEASARRRLLGGVGVPSMLFHKTPLAWVGGGLAVAGMAVAAIIIAALLEGDWLGHLAHERIAEYVEAAREHGLLLFLDTQIGWSDPLTEVRLLAPFLREPFVHVALDPEFATERLGVGPGLAIGSITAEQVNKVQRELARLVREESLPPKILMVHQFTDWMIEGRDAVEDHPEVELAIDMDGFGLARVKVDGSERWALTPPSERPAFKLFFDQDTPVMTPEEVQALDRPPDIVIYQ